ncbi:hypothetical protein TNCV_4286271 [Trichonephila clavipes]|nr:hypothetical protein TNCV_4286271 [Trichonephila clavipes]
MGFFGALRHKQDGGFGFLKHSRYGVDFKHNGAPFLFMPINKKGERKDHCSLVVNVTDLWLVSLEFEPSTAKDPPCRGSRCMLSMSRLEHPAIGVMLKGGKGGASSGVVLVT